MTPLGSSPAVCRLDSRPVRLFRAVPAVRLDYCYACTKPGQPLSPVSPLKLLAWLYERQVAAAPRNLVRLISPVTANLLFAAPALPQLHLAKTFLVCFRRYARCCCTL